MAGVVVDALAARPGQDPLLEVRRLAVRFGPVVALGGVDLEVYPGELVVVAGESGAGKTTLVRCVAGELGRYQGEVRLAGEALVPGRRPEANEAAMVWQDLALCDNLGVAENLTLGRERRFLRRDEPRLRALAADLLDRLGLPLSDLPASVRSLTGAQRQLLAVARALLDRPRLLLLDEPTTALAAQEAALVEGLLGELREEGTAILLVSHDLDQMFRLADRIVVLREGSLVAEVDPRRAHPEDVTALMWGQPVDSSARGQLTRLHALADRLASADRSSSLSLILSTLGAALGIEHLAVHLAGDEGLTCAESLGLPPRLERAWRHLPVGPAGGPVGLAATSGELVVDGNVRTSPAWTPFRHLLAPTRIASSWAVPVTGSDGLLGVVSALRVAPGPPERDELDLVSLYAGYVASFLERDRLFSEVTARNRALESVREVLQILAGPTPLEEGLATALRALAAGLEAAEVALVVRRDGEAPQARAAVDASGAPVEVTPGTLAAAEEVLGLSRPGELVRPGRTGAEPAGLLAVGFVAPGGQAVLLARWLERAAAEDSGALLVDAARSVRLALEREEVGLAHQEAAALRRSQELQRAFLSRLGHELRTPLTGIQGYASSLLQPDVTWDGDSTRRFLTRIAAEASRLGRLVDDLLEFSVIESGILRLQRDWCEPRLVLDAAAACLPPERAVRLKVASPPSLPAIWADHDRLEQVFVNLLDNALRHNPAGTSVFAEARLEDEGDLVVRVSDDGSGIPPTLAADLFEEGRRRRAPTSGTGLGLLIAKGIVEAHGGRIELEATGPGTTFAVHLPVEPPEAGEAEPSEPVSAGLVGP